MSKICPNCGQMLQDQDIFCDRCGQSVGQMQQSRTAANYAAPMKQPRKPGIKWWMIAAPAVLVVVLVVALLWNTIAFAVAPEAVLAGALAKTGAKLEDRSEGTPIALISKAAESMEDNAKMAVVVDYSDEYTGNLNVDAQMLVDMKNKRLLLDGSMSLDGETVDAKFYMDALCAALGSDRFTDGAYYGITYETFSDDLRKCFLYEYMDDESIEQMEMAVDMVEEYWAMLGEEEDSTLDEAYLEILTEYYESMEMETGSEKLSIDGKNRSCKTVSYTTTWGDFVDMYVQIVETMVEDPAYRSYVESYVAAYNAENSYYGMEITVDEMINSVIETAETMDDYFDGDITAVFYLYKNTVAAMDLIMVLDDGTDEVEILAQVLLGENPAKDDIEILVEANADGESLEFEVICTKETDGKEVIETVSFSGDSGYEKIGAELGYVWDAESGDLELSVSASSDGERVSYDMDLILLEVEDGFNLTIEDVVDLFPADTFYEEFHCGVSVTLSKGEEISVPAYSNIDAWTEDEFEAIAEKISEVG